jgi:hypothetical protein
MSLSYEEDAGMHFVYGFATVTPLLLLKNIYPASWWPV